MPAAPPDGDVVGLNSEAAKSLSARERLLAVALRLSRMGGWTVLRNAARVTWTDATAAIHDEPPGTSPTVDAALDYYIPAHRKKIADAVAACLQSGAPFDEILQIVTAKGRHVWVHAIGEAERDAAGTVVAIHGAFQDISELIAAKEESVRLAERLRETVETISDAFFTLGADWRFSFVNQEAGKLLNRDPMDLIGKHVWQEFPEAVESESHRNYRLALEQRRQVTFIDGYPPLGKWFEVRAYPTTEGIAVYFQDITARRADETLRQAETLILEKISSDAPLPAVLAEIAVTLDRAIDGAMASIQLAAPGGDVLTLAAAPNLPPGFAAAVDRVPIAQGAGACGTAAFERRNVVVMDAWTDPLCVDYRDVACQHGVRAIWSSPVIGSENTVLATFAVYLTRHAEPGSRETALLARLRHLVALAIENDRRAQALIESEARFRIVAQAIADVVWDWNLADDTVWWNEGLRIVFGYEVTAVPSAALSWRDYIHADDRARVLKSIYAVIKSAAREWECEYRFTRASGAVAQVTGRGLVIRDREGKAIRMVGSIIDVTDKRRMEEQLRQSQRLDAVGQLTGGVAHDFNNLLTIILGNAELLAEKLAGQTQLRALAEMTRTAAERGAELTARLLAFARRQTLDPRPTDVNALLLGMEGLLRRTLGEHVEIASVQSGDLWRALIDAPQLENAILNLCINARDAMPGGGRLLVETRNKELDADYAARNPDVVPGPYVMVAVSDTGTGMTAEVAARAFDPFFTTKGAGKGTGLGLSMVHGFVKQSKGHVRIYSEPGHGTTVRLYLPRAVAAAREVEAPASQHGQTAGAGERILVVEDDDLVRQNVAAQLEGLCYRVVVARNGREALAVLADDGGIDLLFTDVVMPGGMNGRQLADEAVRLRPGLPVLFTSGYAEDAIVHHGRLDPGVHLLNKPYRRQDLAAKVRQVLGGSTQSA